MDIRFKWHKYSSYGLKVGHTYTDMTTYYRDATRNFQGLMGGVG